MIVHRAARDIERCRTKYGDAWEEYERRVPYLFIPVCFYLLRKPQYLVSAVVARVLTIADQGVI